MIACSGIEHIAAPIDPPKTRRISPGLKYEPMSPSDAWNIEKSTTPQARINPMRVARSMWVARPSPAGA